MSERGLLIALMTAAQESTLRNLEYGDRDSLGLFQQRPSMGWGTPAQVRDPAYAAAAFYGGPASPTSNPGLLSVPGWEAMPLTDPRSGRAGRAGKGPSRWDRRWRAAQDGDQGPGDPQGRGAGRHARTHGTRFKGR